MCSLEEILVALSLPIIAILIIHEQPKSKGKSPTGLETSFCEGPRLSLCPCQKLRLLLQCPVL